MGGWGVVVVCVCGVKGVGVGGRGWEKGGVREYGEMPCKAACTVSGDWGDKGLGWGGGGGKGSVSKQEEMFTKASAD